MTDESDAARRWTDGQWGFVRAHLPSPPARVVELGCGPYGGFVPALRSAGYDALGVDPEAPDGNGYRRIEFEELDHPSPYDAVVASLSLHHTSDLSVALSRIDAMLRPGGAVVILEWDWQRFDEATATWGFQRLDERDESSWLFHMRDHWRSSGHSWSAYLEGWAGEENRLHTGRDMISALDDRFTTTEVARGPYLFRDIPDVSAADETAAIAAGELRAMGIRLVATKK